MDITVGRATALAALVATFVTPQVAQSQDRTYQLSGRSVAVYNLAGEVRIVPGSGSDVEVAVRRQGPDADRLEIRTGRVDLDRGNWGTVEALRVIYPDDEVHYTGGPSGYHTNSQIRVRDDGTFWGGRGGRNVRVSSREGDLEAHADLEIRLPPGKKILVALAIGRIEARNVDGDLHLDTGAGEIMTSATRGSLNLDTGSGDITVDGADGDLWADTGSGNVDARNVRGEEIDADTGSGDVRLEDVEARSIGVDTGSGNVEVLGARTERVGVDTGSGDVRVETTSGSATFSVDTGSGDVEIAVPDSYSGTVLIETSSGELHSDMPITLLRRSDDEIEGRIGEGGSARIEIETGSGDVSLRRI